MMDSSETFIDGIVQGSDWRSLAAAIVVVPLLSITAWWVVAYFTSPLRKYPGPGLAGEFSRDIALRKIIEANEACRC